MFSPAVKSILPKGFAETSLSRMPTPSDPPTPSQYRNIALVGPWGVGKTKLGLALQKRLAECGFRIIHTDDLLREYFGHRSLHQILQDFGEEEYRRGETQVVSALAADSRQVISSGGTLVVSPAQGAFRLNVEALHSLQSHAYVIPLVAKPEKILKSIEENPVRPCKSIDPQVVPEWNRLHRDIGCGRGLHVDLLGGAARCADEIIWRLRKEPRFPQDWLPQKSQNAG